MTKDNPPYPPMNRGRRGDGGSATLHRPGGPETIGPGDGETRRTNDQGQMTKDK
ncbi:hypothetical protein [[Phormidium] sp. ETS-05]|uniref:hypothetical protein n=1 Tax=[Phormidium] sp. ETS-05 TaxID=222819 RepID=UPI0018EF22D9|nr:hypothetical protein [[Phormidium] sp. ETS-05]